MLGLQLNYLSFIIQEELEELQSIVDAERDKLSQERKRVRHEITTQVSEVYNKINMQGFFGSLGKIKRD